MTDGRKAKRQSVHHQIADDIRAAIRSGKYQDGDRLPGENVLMQRYGVARVTQHAHQRYAALNQPAWGRFGVTASPTRQYVWLDSPNSDLIWRVSIDGPP